MKKRLYVVIAALVVMFAFCMAGTTSKAESNSTVKEGPKPGVYATKNTIYDGNCRMKGYEEYVYTSDMQTSFLVKYDYDGNVLQYDCYEMDDEGNMMTFTMDKDFNLVSIIVTSTVEENIIVTETYDEKFNLVQTSEVSYNASAKISERMVYDHVNKTKAKYITCTGADGVSVVTYNRHGIPKKMVVRNADGTNTVYDFNSDGTINTYTICEYLVIE